MSDPIADMLTRIRNANMRKHDTVDVPASKMKIAIANILVDEGYIEKYGNEIDACVLCGTSGPKGAVVRLGLLLVRLIILFMGKDSYVPLLEKLSFGDYNSRIENPVSDLAWLSRNEDNIRLYEMDKWCGIKLTSSFYRDMLSGLLQIHDQEAMRQIPRELPVTSTRLFMAVIIPNLPPRQNAPSSHARTSAPRTTAAPVATDEAILRIFFRRLMRATKSCISTSCVS